MMHNLLRNERKQAPLFYSLSLRATAMPLIPSEIIPEIRFFKKDINKT
jgi:hypothetical protein